jgi:hypothetical protein
MWIRIPRSGIRDGKNRIRDGKKSDPGWKKVGSRIGDKYPEDPQH